MSSAPVGGRPIEAFVDAIGPRADRLLERVNSSPGSEALDATGAGFPPREAI
jgi:hypothetical protein